MTVRMDVLRLIERAREEAARTAEEQKRAAELSGSVVLSLLAASLPAAEKEIQPPLESTTP